MVLERRGHSTQEGRQNNVFSQLLAKPVDGFGSKISGFRYPTSQQQVFEATDLKFATIAPSVSSRTGPAEHPVL